MDDNTWQSICIDWIYKERKARRTFYYVLYRVNGRNVSPVIPILLLPTPQPALAVVGQDQSSSQYLHHDPAEPLRHSHLAAAPL